MRGARRDAESKTCFLASLRGHSKAASPWTPPGEPLLDSSNSISLFYSLGSKGRQKWNDFMCIHTARKCRSKVWGSWLMAQHYGNSSISLGFLQKFLWRIYTYNGLGFVVVVVAAEDRASASPALNELWALSFPRRSTNSCWEGNWSISVISTPRYTLTESAALLLYCKLSLQTRGGR